MFHLRFLFLRSRFLSFLFLRFRFLRFLFLFSLRLFFLNGFQLFFLQRFQSLLESIHQFRDLLWIIHTRTTHFHTFRHIALFTRARSRRTLSLACLGFLAFMAFLAFIASTLAKGGHRLHILGGEIRRIRIVIGKHGIITSGIATTHNRLI